MACTLTILKPSATCSHSFIARVALHYPCSRQIGHTFIVCLFVRFSFIARSSGLRGKARIRSRTHRSPFRAFDAIAGRKEWRRAASAAPPAAERSIRVGESRAKADGARATRLASARKARVESPPSVEVSARKPPARSCSLETRDDSLHRPRLVLPRRPIVENSSRSSAKASFSRETFVEDWKDDTSTFVATRRRHRRLGCILRPHSW